MAATSRAAVGCCRQRQLCWQKAAVRLKMSGILASMLSIVLQVCLCTVSVIGMLTCRMQTLCHQLEAVELCKQRASTKQKQCDRAVAALHACQQRSRTCTGLHSVHVMFCSKRCWCVASRLQPSVPSPAWRVRLQCSASSGMQPSFLQQQQAGVVDWYVKGEFAFYVCVSDSIAAQAAAVVRCCAVARALCAVFPALDA